MKPTTSPYIVAKKSRIHGTGVFAKKLIPKDARVIEYVGKKVTKTQADDISDAGIDAAKKDPAKGAVYLFELNKRHDVDGNVPWNTAKYINHSCDPNCEVDIIRGRIWVIALQDIKKGEELGYNYGYDIDDFEDHPCRCGQAKCVGYILDEDEWPRLKRKLAKKK